MHIIFIKQWQDHSNSTCNKFLVWNWMEFAINVQAMDKKSLKLELNFLKIFQTTVKQTWNNKFKKNILQFESIGICS